MKPALELEIARELTAEDIAALADTRAGFPSKPSSIERLSQRHHLLARYIARDFPLEQAAILAGYSIPGARALTNDPTFGDLIKFYMGEQEETQEVLRAKLAGITMEAADELLARLENDETRAKVPIAQLEKLATMGLDRLGLGVSTKQEINATIGIADRLEAARKRMKVIEHE